jgi:arylsulfatase
VRARAALPALLLAACGQAPPAHPNVVVWLVDTLRADHLGCYGEQRQTSPHLDALAHDGVLFENVHAASNWTQPSVAALLSGRLPGAFDASFGSPLPAGLPLLAERFAQAGYDTAGYTCTVATAARFGFARGFHEYDELDELLDMDARRKREDAVYGADRLVDAATRFLQRRTQPPPDTRPFLLWLHSVDPHAPYGGRTAGESFAGPYDGPIDGSVESIANAGRIGYEYTEADRQHVEDLYDDDVRFNDQQLGRLVNELQRLGLLEDTLIVVVADHGEELWERGALGHGNTDLHAELTHVPLVLHWPEGLPDGLRVPALVGGVDLAPTLLELCGLPPLPETDGVSRAALARGAGGPGAAALLLDRCRPQDPAGALRTADWLLHGGDDPALAGLFDLRNDPGERRDLSGAREADATRMREALSGLRTQRDVAWSAVGGGGPTVAPDAATLEKLRALGYLGEGQ